MEEKKTDIDVKGNGHKDAIPEEFKAIIDQGTFDSAFTMQEITSAIKVLVERGKETKDFILRGRFPNPVVMKAAMRHLAKCVEFGDKEGQEELLNVLAGFPAVGGLRIQELIEAIIGENNRYRARAGFMDTVKNWAGVKQDENKQR